jgi:hypothetical protein
MIPLDDWMALMTNCYRHYPLNEEVTAIGGHYVVTREVRLPYRNWEVLYTTGYAVMDTTCCGMGGCGYVTVYGFIERWQAGVDEDGHPLTEVSPVRDGQQRADLESIIRARETVNQVNFV